MHQVKYAGPSDAKLLSAKLEYRLCRTPDKKRVVAAWLLYEDVRDLFPADYGWQPPDTPFPHPFEIRAVESKGRGMIATRNIKCGELIVRERPIIMVPRVSFGNAKAVWHEMDKRLLQLLYMLEQEDREKFVQLHNCKSLNECGPLTGIVRTNGIAAIFPFSGICHEYSSVSVNISYVNHSCTPNASHDFDQKSMTSLLRATQDIAEGEEITISYLDMSMPLADRQARLQAHYRFTCACSACSYTSAASDERRRLISKTLNNVGTMWDEWVDGPPSTRASRAERDFKIMESVLRAMDEENLRTKRITALQHLGFMYGTLGDVKNFRKWGEECVKELAANKDTKGNDYENMYPLWKNWIRNPTLFFGWRMWG